MPIEERLALLVLRLRAAEPVTRVTIQTFSPEGSNAGDRRPAAALLQPLAGLPGAGSIALRVEGSYLTRFGLEAFLAAGRSAGASIATLTVNDRRFRADFQLYGRI